MVMLLRILLALIFFVSLLGCVHSPWHYAYLVILFIAYGVCCGITAIEKLIAEYKQ